MLEPASQTLAPPLSESAGKSLDLYGFWNVLNTIVIDRGYYFYYLVEEKGSKAVKEFDRVALINENIIRHVVVKVDE